eukprot:CAMPEP_0170752694 /NCGR_PEP_ID=MMETSP0437-20130122/12100_1 /TAXON_ID=0 /ORGANISM="Sexangularia sp." /LENGTH=697 /DNA_ID=CAMNT_0011091771 /DNA_START=35 /DNA_END=2125 /DNA_ORIENTATION=-
MIKGTVPMDRTLPHVGVALTNLEADASTDLCQFALHYYCYYGIPFTPQQPYTVIWTEIQKRVQHAVEEQVAQAMWQVERQRGLAKVDSPTLFVGSLPPNTAQLDVTDALRLQPADVLSLRVVPGKNIAFVTLPSAQAARHVLEAEAAVGGYFIGSSRLRVSPANQRTTAPAGPPGAAGAPGAPGGAHGSGQAAADGQAANPEIFVSELPDHVTIPEVKRHFDALGAIKSITLLRPQRAALVMFASDAEATAALSLSGSLLAGQRILVRKGLAELRQRRKRDRAKAALLPLVRSEVLERLEGAEGQLTLTAQPSSTTSTTNTTSTPSGTSAAATSAAATTATAASSSVSSPPTLKPAPDPAPPPASAPLKSLIEKTVTHARKMGPAFLDMIRRKNRQNEKFAFLFPGGEGHEFFEWRYFLSAPEEEQAERVRLGEMERQGGVGRVGALGLIAAGQDKDDPHAAQQGTATPNANASVATAHGANASAPAHPSTATAAPANAAGAAPTAVPVPVSVALAAARGGDANSSGAPTPTAASATGSATGGDDEASVSTQVPLSPADVELLMAALASDASAESNLLSLNRGATTATFVWLSHRQPRHHTSLLSLCRSLSISPSLPLQQQAALALGLVTWQEKVALQPANASTLVTVVANLLQPLAASPLYHPLAVEVARALVAAVPAAADNERVAALQGEAGQGG